MIEFRDTGYGYLRDNSEEYVQIDLDDGAAILDGAFDIDHLEQILTKMKENLLLPSPYQTGSEYEDNREGDEEGMLFI